MDVDLSFRDNPRLCVQAPGSSQRSTHMSVVHQRLAGNADGSVDLSSAIVIADDPAIRQRICAILEEQDLRPLAQIGDPLTITEFDLDESTIIVFVCDVDVPREVAALRRLCREARQAAVVVISPPATGPGARRTLDAGADALVFDSELELTLTTTLRAVASGQSVVPRKLRASVERPNLSHREHQVLALVRQGLTNAEIAEQLYLAESTIKSHLASVFTKFGVHSRKEAIAVFIDLELGSEAGVVSLAPANNHKSPEQAPA